MAFHVIPPLAQLRPRDNILYASRNRTVLATARDGFIHGNADEGLFVFQTRLLSLYRYWINGQSPRPVAISNLEEHSQIAYYAAKADDLPATVYTLELRLLRVLSDGLDESVELQNHSQRSTKLTLEIELDADFADAAEAHGERRQHGTIERQWQTGAENCQLTWTYTATHNYDHQGNWGTATLRRGARITIPQAGPCVRYDEQQKRVVFEIVLAPRGVWQCSILLSALIDGRVYEPQAAEAAYQKTCRQFLQDCTQFEIGSPPLAFVVHRALEQAKRDLIGLRLFDLPRDGRGWTMAAGVPTYLSFFGRDALTAAWQASLLSSEMMEGTLAELAATQATEYDDWRDSAPGLFVHQMDTGPLAALMFNPLGCYYGTFTGPAFFPVALSNLWHWTGNRDLIRPFLEVALRGFQWLDRDAKRGHGFYAYQSRSEQGLQNQAWKDSSDAIVYPDGTRVTPPIAATESQAFVYASKVRMSELLWWFGEKLLARKFFQEAMDLRDRFNEVYWMEEGGCYGMGLDAAGRLIRSIGSESAHAVAAGIVKKARAARTVERLFQPDLFSGWGIRTLSAQHPAYNPLSYHRGSVWPAEQAAFSMGLMRYGLHEHLHRLTKAQFEAAALFEYFRLPEVFSGHARDARHPIPALYQDADSPQAWSASAVFCMLQALLGLFPYAPLHVLFVDPHLPDWLPEIHLRNLRVGDATVDLEFRRSRKGKSSYRVRRLQGKLHVIRQPSPWSLTSTFTERVIDAISSLIPRL